MAGFAERTARRPLPWLFVLVAAFADATQAAAPAAGKLTAVEKPAAAAAFELNDMSGKTHRLSDYRGKVVLVNFWATWCEPCRDEMPSMRTLKERMDGVRKDDFVVLAVNYGENEIKIASFLRQQPALGFPVLLDPFGKVWSDWKPGLLPASFLIGRDGRVRYRALGEIDWAGKEAEATVRRLLEEKTR
jgi:thiol-disulfide isomerase/thioredoxin